MNKANSHKKMYFNKEMKRNVNYREKMITAKNSIKIKKNSLIIWKGLRFKKKYKYLILKFQYNLRWYQR